MAIPQPNNASNNPFDHLLEEDLKQLFDNLSEEALISDLSHNTTPKAGLWQDSSAQNTEFTHFRAAPEPFPELDSDLWDDNAHKSPALSSDAVINNFFAEFAEEESLEKSLEGSFNSPQERLVDNSVLLPDETASFSLNSSTKTVEPIYLDISLFAIGPEWVRTWEQLETLIDQPTPYSPIPQDRLLTNLEALIDAPVAQVSLVDSLSSLPSSADDTSFRDLESLLEEAKLTMGGTSTLTRTGGIRLNPRLRSPKTKIFEQTMRVPVKQLDNINNLIGELVVKRNRIEKDQDRLHQFLDNLLNQAQTLSDIGGRMQDLYERTLLEGALLATRHSHQAFTHPSRPLPQNLGSPDLPPNHPPTDSEEGLDALEMDRFTGFHLLSQEMIELTVRVRESASDIQFLVDETEQVSLSLRQVTDQLQEGMTQARMVPFAQVADRLPRAIRDISLRLNKQVELLVEGKDVSIDKVILEHLYNPMTHLVNNAIAHGIESPHLRQQQGKDPIGRITIRAFLQGNQTVITVADDGAGIDIEQVKAKALEHGLISPAEAAVFTQQMAYELLFQPGFSTRDDVDDFAGRGVGLDVVQTNLNDIRGLVTIDSILNQGTTFTIRLPLTLTICQALCCLSNQARIAFPLDCVEQTKDYGISELFSNDVNQRCIRWNNSLLPIYPLGDLLIYSHPWNRARFYSRKPQKNTVSIVILQGDGNFLAIEVDQVIGEEEIVIKQIEGPIPKPMGIAGTTIRGDGRIMPIADVLELIELAQGRISRNHSANFWEQSGVQTKPENLKTELTVLIVDDSVTVRELLSLRFTKAGYRVEQARDGQEAWEKLQTGLPCQLVFCDIEMPRMNGLELLAKLRQDQRLSSIPFALLTSRGDESHRKAAEKLGANGYFTKPYTEKDLLDSAQRLIQGEVLLLGSNRISHPLEEDAAQAFAFPHFDHRSAQGKKKEEASVLIVDDSVTVREMLSMTFSQAGYRVEQARDGQDAWEKLEKQVAYAQSAYDLILCDIEMPRLNGLELLSRLQEDRRFYRIPVAMITSRGAQKMQRLAADRGAKGYFVKPYLEEVLLASAQRLIAGEILLDANSIRDY